MKQILFIITLYSYIPSHAMEPFEDTRLGSQELITPLDQLPITEQNNAELLRHYPILAPRKPTTCKSLVKSCKKLGCTFFVPIPLALTGFGLGLFGAHEPLLRHIALGFDGASLLWFGAWFAAHYRELENERQEYIRQLTAYRNALREHQNSSFGEEQEVEPLLDSEN